MPRKSVYVPEELWSRVEEELSGVNVSALLQEALRAALECSHDELTCLGCATSLTRADVAHERTEALYRDLMGKLEDLVRSGGTATGAAKVLRDVGRAHQVEAADILPLPRPSRAEAAAAREKADRTKRARAPQLPETWRARG